MNKWGAIALSCCLFGLVGGEVWAGCCSYPGSCEETPNYNDCKSRHGSSSRFFSRLICCPEGTNYNGQCKPNFDKCNKGSLVALSNFTIVPLPGDFDLKWKTSSELDNAGFFIWRGTKEGDEYKNVHRVSELIPAEGGLVGGANYSYTDTIPDFKKGTVYCYGLEDVDTRGMTSFHYDFIRCSPQ